ncbi:MAG: NAD-dependent epimerase/dehydratase family protein [Patescibacteria group bacterium]
MNVLITGGTGFIGKHLVDALVKKGHLVKVIARNPQKAEPVKKLGVRVVIGDLGNKEFLKKELEGIEIVYHLAAIPGQAWGIPWEEYKKVNVDFTKNLLKAAVQNKIEKFIFCSSVQAVDPSTFYGKSKLEAEKEVKKSNLEYVIVRPGVVYGPGDKQAILRICQLVKKGFFPLIGGGKTKLAIIFIDDLIDLFLQCLTSKVKNKTIWGIGEEITYKNLVKIIGKELGKPCWQVFLPAPLVKTVAFPLEAISSITGIRPLVTRAQVDFVTFGWYFAVPKEQKRIWQPKAKFAEEIKKTIEWYKENGYL